MAPVPPRTVAVVGAVCVTVGWLLASTLTPPVARLQSLPERGARPVATPADVSFTEHLQLRLRRLPDPPTPRRNPFSFGSRRQPRLATPVRREELAIEAAPEAVVVATGPNLFLAGIGVTGEQRTAILTDGQGVHVVKPGDRVGGYTVVEITDQSVTLAEPSGARHVLSLR